MSGSMGALATYAALFGAVEGPAGKLEMARGIARAAGARLMGRRGALHVRKPVVLSSGGLRWWVPAWDNSFATCAPGADNGRVLPEMLAILRERPQPVVLDVGANLGYVCMSIARHERSRRVIAIEPVPWLADALEHTAKLNRFDAVSVVPKAISDGEWLDLGIPHQEGVHFTTLTTSTAEHDREGGRAPRREIRVPATTLDAVLEENGFRPEDVACVKIDVEGAEPIALATGRHALSARPPVVFEAFGEPARREVEAVLAPLGFTRYRQIDHNNFIATA